jgi:hypothetical protein
MILEIPVDAKLYEMTSSVIWFDKDGIMYSVAKEDAPIDRSMEDIRKEMDALRKIIGNKKVCLIIESNSRGTSPPKEQRDFLAEQINSITKAMAIISTSPLSRMVANLFFSFKPPPYPFKMFSNEKDAKQWIKQFV